MGVISGLQALLDLGAHPFVSQLKAQTRHNPCDQIIKLGTCGTAFVMAWLPALVHGKRRRVAVILLGLK